MATLYRPMDHHHPVFRNSVLHEHKASVSHADPGYGIAVMSLSEKLLAWLGNQGEPPETAMAALCSASVTMMLSGDNPQLARKHFIDGIDRMLLAYRMARD